MKNRLRSAIARGVAVTLALSVSVVATLSPAVVEAGTGSVRSVPPARVLESRIGPGFDTFDGLFEGTGRIGAGQVLELTVAGRAGVPLDAEAVFLNVVAVLPGFGGYVTVFPCGITPPLAANVN